MTCCNSTWSPTTARYISKSISEKNIKHHRSQEIIDALQIISGLTSEEKPWVKRALNYGIT